MNRDLNRFDQYKYQDSDNAIRFESIWPEKLPGTIKMKRDLKGLSSKSIKNSDNKMSIWINLFI